MIPISPLRSRASHPDCPFPDPSRTRVLVVKDDLLVGAMPAEALEEAGFVVLTAASAEEAIEVLFTDIDLGGRDDCDLARRALTGQPSLAGILASGRSRRCHADSMPPQAVFLPKPYRLSHLIGEVQRATQAASPQ